MKIIYYLCFIAIAFFTCCSSNKRNNVKSPQKIACDIDSSAQVCSLSEICDSVTLIPLETNDSLHVGIVSKMIVNSDRMFILSNQRIYIYDRQGKIFHVISEIGHAKNEYVEINDFCVSKSHVFITDVNSKKILLFSKDGYYEKTIKTTQFPEKIASINDSLLAISCSGTEGPRLIIMNTNEEIVKGEYFEYDKRFTSPVPQVFTCSDSNLLYKQPFSNMYYSVNKDASVDNYYSIDFKKYNFQEKDLGTVNFAGCKLLIDKKGNANIIRFHETTSLYQIEFSCERYFSDAQFIMLINKKTGKEYLINSDTYKDDITFYDYRILPDFSFLHGDKFWGVIYPASWKGCLKKIEPDRCNNSRFEATKRYVENISADQNPIVCVYHIKKEI